MPAVCQHAPNNHSMFAVLSRLLWLPFFRHIAGGVNYVAMRFVQEVLEVLLLAGYALPLAQEVANLLARLQVTIHTLTAWVHGRAKNIYHLKGAYGVEIRV